MNTICMNCGHAFICERNDAQFCGDMCRAAYYRSAGATGKHVPLERFKSKICGFCGCQFWFNAYADRSGKREPQYHNAACRKKAFMERSKAAREAQKRSQANPKGYDAFRETFEKAKAERTSKQQASASGDFRDGLKIPRRWNETDCYLWIFGTTQIRGKAEVVNECRKLNLLYHPDLNSGRVYKHLSTINAAWDYLKRHSWK